VTIDIGTTRRGKRITLTDAERARHVHVVGASDMGKSRFLESMIRDDIKKRRGLCLIDPHGTLADRLEMWCASRGLGRTRRIHLIRPGDDNLIPGFNPLRMVEGEAISVRVDAMVAACGQAWGVANLDDTPRLEKILRATFYALSVRGLTLAEGTALLQAGDPAGVRGRVIENLPDPEMQVVWDELNGMGEREFREHVESTITRLSRFLNAPAMRLVVGQHTHAIDFRQAMDNDEIVIVNLGARSAFSYENARVFGTMLINDMFLTALARDEKWAAKHPFTLYVDEAYDFLSGDIERMLDQTRKFGLHAVLAHQRVGQLKARGDNIYDAVMGGTQTKIVFNLVSDDDAAIMARQVMRGDIDLERPKKGFTMPVVVDEVPFWLDSETETAGGSSGTQTTRSSTSGQGTSSGTSHQEGRIEREGEELDQRNINEGNSEGESSFSSDGVAFAESEGRNWSQSHGRHQTLKPVRQERPTQLYSLDESLHLAQLKLQQLPKRIAIMKGDRKRTIRFKTLDVKDPLNVAGNLKRLRAIVAERSPYLIPRAEAEAQIAERRAALGIPAAGETIEPPLFEVKWE
jgi:hypothetical protein